MKCVCRLMQKCVKIRLSYQNIVIKIVTHSVNENITETSVRCEGRFMDMSCFVTMIRNSWASGNEAGGIMHLNESHGEISRHTDKVRISGNIVTEWLHPESILSEFHVTADGNNNIKWEETTFLPNLRIIHWETMLGDLTKGNKCKLAVKGTNFYSARKTRHQFANFEY